MTSVPARVERSMLDLETLAIGSNITRSNILLLDFFLFSRIKASDANIDINAIIVRLWDNFIDCRRW